MMGSSASRDRAMKRPLSLATALADRVVGRRAAVLTALLLGLSIIVMVLISVSLATALSGEIKTMAGVMATLAGGNTGVELPYDRRRDEIGIMARAVQVFKNSLIKLSMSEASTKCLE